MGPIKKIKNRICIGVSALIMLVDMEMCEEQFF
jgi:hypothetical protein